MAVLLIRLYSLLWLFALPFLRCSHRLREGFSWRLVPKNWVKISGLPADNASRKSHGVDVWIQAASGGEAYLAWEIIKHLVELRRRAGLMESRPLRLLVTTWTRQGLEILQGMAAKQAYPDISIRTTFFPFDSFCLMNRALDQARPKVVALLETELWPGLLLACARRNIPVFILNGRMTAKSLRGYRCLEAVCSGFWQQMAPQRIAAVSPGDAARFAELFGRERVEIAPNIKFDRAVPQKQDAHTIPTFANLLPTAVHSGRTILLASVRTEEEEDLMRVLRYLRTGSLRDAPPTIIIAPRHMHRVRSWCERLRAEGLTPLTRAGRVQVFPAGAIIVWDTFGELGGLYRLADAVFVGGSLAPLGGQNFLEPLGLGRIPCCGPSLENFAWALEGTAEAPEDRLEARGLLHRCADAYSVATILKQAIVAPHEAPQAVAARFYNWLAPRRGGALYCARLIEQAMQDLPPPGPARVTSGRQNP